MVNFCGIVSIVNLFLDLFRMLLIGYALSTWFPNLRDVTLVLRRLCAPLLDPIEQLLPANFRMFSVLVAFLVIWFVQWYSGQVVCHL